MARLKAMRTKLGTFSFQIEMFTKREVDKWNILSGHVVITSTRDYVQEEAR